MLAGAAVTWVATRRKVMAPFSCAPVALVVKITEAAFAVPPASTPALTGEVASSLSARARDFAVASASLVAATKERWKPLGSVIELLAKSGCTPAAPPADSRRRSS
jgi:hypothetical protein